MDIYLTVDGKAVRINKSQRAIFTEDVINQLQKKTKLILSRTDSLYWQRNEGSDPNVPDLTNIASYVECTTTCEFDKMPKSFISPTSHELKSISKKKSNKIFKNRDQLIRIFGSILEEIEVGTKRSPKKINQKRRQSLPVSITISNEDFFVPLKVSKLNIAMVSELPAVELSLPAEFTQEKIDFKFISSTTVLDETCVARATPKPQTSSRIEIAKNTTIDLPRKTNLESTSRKTYLSMPLLSPTVAPTAQSSSITIPPNTTQQIPTAPPFTSEKAISITPLPPNTVTQQVPTTPPTSEKTNSLFQEIMAELNNNMQKRVEINTRLGFGGGLVATTPQSVSVPTKLKRARATKHPTPKQSTVQQTDLQRLGQMQPSVAFSVQQQKQTYTPAGQQATKGPVQPASQPDLQRISHMQPPVVFSGQQQNQVGPPAPKLIRLNYPIQDGYHLISNADFAIKVFPYLYVYTKWRDNACKYCTNMSSFLDQRTFKTNYQAFLVYANHTVKTFGKKMIRDLLSVHVDNFSLQEVFTALCKKIQEKSLDMNVYKICINFHSMLTGCEAYCNTPLTKTFFNHIKIAMKAIEAKSHQGCPLFQPSQLHVLETQINQYLLIENWLKRFAAAYISTPMRPAPRVPNQIHPELLNVLSKPVPERPSLTVQSTILPSVSINDSTGTTSVNVPPAPIGANQVRSTSLHYKPSVKDCPVIVENPNFRIITTEAIIDLCDSDLPMKEESEEGTIKGIDFNCNEVIDLTWIDDGDEAEMIEEITKHREFHPVVESDASSRETVSPADSGLGSPTLQGDRDDYKCLCGEKATYICACQLSMYCSRDCQISDWPEHQKWCKNNKT